MTYTAPYSINTELVPIPTEGTFLLPVCTTAERLAKILSALYYGGLNISSEGDMTHLVDVLDAIGKIRPECDLEPTGCTTFVSAQDRITYFPALDAEDLPLGYLTNSWVKLTGDNPLVGLKTGDIITDIPHMPLLPSVWDHLDEPTFILLLGYPSISITGLMGSGTLRVYLLNILLGGKAIVVKDNNIFSLAFLDTNLDAASLPPETYTEHLIEYKFEGAGEHRLDIVFVPSVSADIEFLGYGGGIRKVEICGFEENTMPENCCDETNEKIGQTNDLLATMLKILQNGFKIVPFEGNTLPPDIGGGACAPAFFDHDTDETDEAVLLQRQKALCITAERYVKGILIAALIEMGAPSALVDYVDSQLPLELPPAFTKLQVVYPSVFSGLTAFFLALTGGAELPLIACQMVIALQGEINNTFINFRSSVNAPLLAALLVPLAGLVQSSNGLAKNYQLFNLALHDANEEDLSAYSCPCGIEQNCETELELTGNIAGGDVYTVITLTETPNVYHIVQDTHQDPTNDNRYIASVIDTGGRCLKFAQVSGMTQVPIYASQRVGCTGVGDGCDSEDLDGGGAIAFAPTTAVMMGWQSVAPIDTYLEIICCIPD